MLRLSIPFEKVKNWLLFSGLFVNNNNDKNCGAVYSFYNEKKKEFCFLYPEITGYFLSALRFLYDIEKNRNYLEYSKLSANWLVSIYDKYGGIIQGFSLDSAKKELIYSFDTAICAKGLLDSFVITGEEKYLEYAKKMIWYLTDEALENDGSVKPYKNLKTNEFEESKDVWYKRKGCFHIKTAIPFIQLYEITNDRRLFENAVKILNTYSKYQNPDGSFNLHQNDKVINLHTLCYALEGLLFGYQVTKNDNYLKSCSDAANWCAEKIENDGSINLWFNSKYKSKAAYSVAQLIRIMILLSSLNKNDTYKKNVDKLHSFQILLQAVTNDPKIDGGFYEELYKFAFNWKKRPRLNSWTSMFALQSLYWFENYHEIAFDKASKSLY